MAFSSIMKKTLIANKGGETEGNSNLYSVRAKA